MKINQELNGFVGYANGSGVLRGVGKGLVGVIGLPVSGALGLVSAASTGLAAATGMFVFRTYQNPRTILLYTCVNLLLLGAREEAPAMWRGFLKCIDSLQLFS